MTDWNELDMYEEKNGKKVLSHHYRKWINTDNKSFNQRVRQQRFNYGDKSARDFFIENYTDVYITESNVNGTSLGYIIEKNINHYGGKEKFGNMLYESIFIRHD